MSLDVTLFNEEETEFYHTDNITHNLAKMADESMLYEVIWRPHELGITHAKGLIQPLSLGLEILKEHKETLEEFNSPNGWGTYENLLKFTEDYLEACLENPEAKIVIHG